MTAYKFLSTNHRGPYTEFDFTPYLPTDDQPGPWLPEVETIELCESGYHACTDKHLIEWVNVELWEVELDGEIKSNDDKIVSQRMRFIRQLPWTDMDCHRLACWSVRQVWHLLTDERSRTVIEVKERWIEGKATDEELDAARDAWAARAAWDASWDARAAAWAAMAASRVARAASRAARSAPWDARAAAWAAQNDYIRKVAGV